jgi:hypothetical protein
MRISWLYPSKKSPKRRLVRRLALVLHTQMFELNGHAQACYLCVMQSLKHNLMKPTLESVCE